MQKTQLNAFAFRNAFFCISAFKSTKRRGTCATNTMQRQKELRREKVKVEKAIEELRDRERRAREMRKTLEKRLVRIARDQDLLHRGGYSGVVEQGWRL